MTFGDKFTAQVWINPTLTLNKHLKGYLLQEVDDAFSEFKIEDGMIDAVHLKSLMVAKKDEE